MERSAGIGISLAPNKNGDDTVACANLKAPIKTFDRKLSANMSSNSCFVKQVSLL